MRIFFDTEFIEYPPRSSSHTPANEAAYKATIDLISIGLVSEDGREYYAIHNNFNETMANDWVKENVIDKLETDIKRKSLSQIAKDIMEFAPPKTYPEFYAYFCNYDWVVFCWIFGTMMDLPDGYPMFCRDIKQIMKMLSITKEDLPEQEEGTHHNALADAKWNKAAFDYLSYYVDANINQWTRHPSPKIIL